MVTNSDTGGAGKAEIRSHLFGIFFTSLLYCVLSTDPSPSSLLILLWWPKADDHQWDRLEKLQELQNWPLHQPGNREGNFVPSVTLLIFNPHGTSCQSRKAKAVSSAGSAKMFKFMIFVTNLSRNLAPEVCAVDLYFWILFYLPLSQLSRSFTKKKQICFIPNSQNSAAHQREAHKVQVVLVWFPEALSKQLQFQLRGAPAAQHHPENHSGNTSTAVKLLQRCHKLHCQMKNDIFTLQ